jgi:hypothetical protein
MYDTFEGMVPPTYKDYTLETTVLYHANIEKLIIIGNLIKKIIIMNGVIVLLKK